MRDAVRHAAQLNRGGGLVRHAAQLNRGGGLVRHAAEACSSTEQR